MSTEYIQSLIDPFDNQFAQPKLYDGSQQRSSGVRFRNTGNITLDVAGGINYLVLFPGFSNGLAWKKPADATYLTHALYPTHVDDATDRGNITRIRVVSAGLQLSLLNSSDENEGYWEAVRVPIQNADLGQNGADYSTLPVPAFAIADMANHHTFQTGKLRDIHRFQFKLNSTSPDHDFKMVPVSGTEYGISTWDPAFDMVVIKIVGRVDAVTPSLLKYDVVSNQEVVYTENTSLSRLMTKNITIPDIEMLHEATRYILPAIQIA